MFSNRLVFAALAVACVTAAGLGGYVATRQATESTQAASVPVDERGEPGATSPAPSSSDTSSARTTATAPEATVAERSSVEPRSEPPVAEPARSPREVATARTEPVARQTAAGRARRTPAPKATASPVTSAPEARRGGAGSTVTVAETVTPQINAPAAVEPAPPATADAGHAPVEPAAAPDAWPAAPSDAVNRGPDLEELVVAADSVIGLHLQHGVSSETARVEDEVEARVVRDVRVGRRVAIPAGSRALGTVALVERGGRFKERARLGIRFHTLLLGDGSRLPISTDTIYRYGDAQGDKSAKKIGGGAVAGAILGAIVGGAKGAAVGATAGAGGGTAMVMAGDRSAAEFPSGSDVTARILSPITVTVER